MIMIVKFQVTKCLFSIIYFNYNLEADELQSVSVASSSKPVCNKFQGLKFLNNNLPPQFENNSKENTIQFYMPRKLSKGLQKQCERLVLRATISCGWSFDWVDNPEAKAMLNKGLNLPKRRSLSDRILEDHIWYK